MRLTSAKRVFAIVLTVAMVIGIGLLPVSALEVTTDEEYISVFVKDGAAKQEQYGSDAEIGEIAVLGEAPKIENDATLGRDVMVFDRTGSYKLGAVMGALPSPQDYTFELLVYVSSDVKDQSEVILMGNCSNQSGTGIWLQRESGETTHRISIFAHNGDDYMDVPGTECLYDQWMHVVGVHDDTTQTITLYVNGKDCGTTELEAPVNFWTRFQGTSDKLVLGSNHDFGGGGAFVPVGAMNGKIAYAKVYDKAVSAADVAELYAASGLQGGGATENPDNNGGSATAAPTKTPNQPNAGTFDMGIVSFAAVALSSLVAVKKRK